MTATPGRGADVRRNSARAISAGTAPRAAAVSYFEDAASRPTATGVGGGVRLLAVGLTPELRALLQREVDDALDLTVVPDLASAARQLSRETWDVLVARLDDGWDGALDWWLEALERLERRPRLLAIAERPSLDLVVRAAKLGWVDVLPSRPSRAEVRRALQRVRHEAFETPVPLERSSDGHRGQLLGESGPMVELYTLLTRVAPSTATVLIEGESGTGKEVVARYLHAQGPSAAGPFVAVNCASIPGSLLESALFGHEKGAFTGAVARRMGSFERARGGTLFLDEVAEMGPALQVKILRAIQEREIERVGGGQTVPVDVRLIAATNRDVDAVVRDGTLREDLYYRLAVVRVRLPPLSRRGEDVILLASHFARQYAEQYDKPILAISDRALELLRRHRWVGNVRELQNAIERAVIVATGDVLRGEHLPEEIRGRTLEQPVEASGRTLAEVEARHIRRVLRQTEGHLSRTAEILGIHRNTLSRRMTRYGLRAESNGA
jgi:DNA-binding NtrC family response regulator